jgi:stage II sporulation protein R
MNDGMKKNMLLFFVLTLALLLCLPGRWKSASAHRESGQSVYESVFRLHVIANSDSAEDQAAKLRVRDAILAYERARMEDAETAEEARARLMEDGAGLLFAAERALAECGMDYGASLEIGTFPFPQREYGAEVYPAGEYAALRVVLGAGKGQNWWCVMFPPLCILELPGGEIDYEELKTNSLLIKLLKSIDGGKLWNTISEKLR